MPDTHRVILTGDALGDLEDIADFIRRHSPQNAAAVAKQILDAIDSLAFLPARFKQVGRKEQERRLAGPRDGRAALCTLLPGR